MTELITNIVSIVIAVAASTGFWNFIQNRKNNKDDSIALLLALAQDRIVQLGMNYIEQGHITQEEHAHLLSMYEPYKKRGGNGAAEKVMAEVNRLPICTSVYFGGNNGDK